MAAKARSGGSGEAQVEAVQVIYGALEPLSPEERERVIASVQALFGSLPKATSPPASSSAVSSSQASVRPVSLVEVIQDKRPKTNIDNITLFAYYRDQYERLPRFARNDLRGYFSKARLGPPGNYDRDFVEAVKRGWLHEDGSESYITSKGLEAVESGFPTERRIKETKTRSSVRRKPSAKTSKKKSSSTKAR